MKALHLIRSYHHGKKISKNIFHKINKNNQNIVKKKNGLSFLYKPRMHSSIYHHKNIIIYVIEIRIN